ncbi:MAG TPA: protein kinase [Polyangiaceae bacterium]|nr:protein kinase [Polyangiaceae bacterium]
MRRIGAHEVVGVLGRSAANEVLLATTRGPHGFVRPVVVKCVREPEFAEPGASHALAREALAYARLNHACVVQLYEVIEDDDQVALVLEYVPGASLARVRGLLAQYERRLTDASALYVMASVFAALAAAHEARDPWTGEFVPVVHRDVNPNNVLLSWDGAVKLTDFGIAKVTGVASDTCVGLVKGTYGYMAPEQVLGEAITPRTDVYCACLLLRELLLGRRNFDPRGKHELELMKEMAEPGLEPIERLRAGVPPVIAGALRAGLEPNPDARSVTAADMRDMLWAFVRADDARRQLAATLAAFRGEIQVLPCEQSVTSGRPSIPSAEPEPSSSPSLVPSPAPPATTLKVPTPYAVAQSIAPVHLSASSRPKADGIVLLLTSAVCAAMVGLLLLPRRAGPQTKTQTQTQIAVAPSVEAPPQEPAVPSVDPAPSEGLPAPASSGDLVCPAGGVSHRVYVDGRVVGESGQTFRMRCGQHVVRIGSAGRDQHVLVPCGGEIEIQAQW